MDKSRPLLSVILSAHNAELYIAVALDSILNQTHSNIELIIADDGSSDTTRKIIDSYKDSRIKRFHNTTNFGKIHTVNTLYQQIDKKSRYVSIHDADDISLKERFEKQISFLEENDSVGFLGTSFVSFTSEGKEFSEIIMPYSIENIKSNIIKSSCFHGPTIVFRRECLDTQQQIYRPYFENYNEDCDLNCRLLYRYNGVNLKDVLYQYRILPNSLSKTLTPRKKVMYQIVAHLYKQRLETGSDQLDAGQEDALNSMISDLTIDYTMDSSKILREQAELFMYYQLNANAIKSAIKAILDSPFRLKNWGTLQYCIRKTVL